jgi:hypothetical protein
MPKQTIQTFFKDGSYEGIEVNKPSCILPSGSKLYITLEISSTYQCEDTKQKFLQKNLDSNVKAILTRASFNIYNDLYNTSNQNQASSGKYKIRGNKLYANIFGYSHTLGKICKQLQIYILTSTGFISKRYYLDNHGQYKLFRTVNYTLSLF